MKMEGNEEKIVRLLRAESSRERNEGCKLMIAAYKAKVVSWVKKQQGNIDPEDIWQSASILMVLAIQSGKYQLQSNAKMYTYFHTIVFSVWAKDSKYQTHFSNLDESHETISEQNNDLQPDIALELKQKKELIERCFEKLDKRSQEILKAVIYEERKIQEIYLEFDLKTPNNAKQKLFTLKNKLIACLKNQFGYGKEY